MSDICLDIDTYSIDEPDKLRAFIERELKPKNKEKRQHGEVFTSLILVNEMLDSLDNEYIKQKGKSIFCEKDFKWFDPAVGIGNFPIVLYERLMTGLKERIPDDADRKLHILEEMIYACELSETNVSTYKHIFSSDTYKLNIYQGDTLDIIHTNRYNLPVFDVIIGNPPYQGTGRKKIYINFIHDLLEEKLKDGGYMLFITPKLALMYLLGANVSQKTIDKFYNVLYINTSDVIKNDYFKNIGSDFMYFIISNSVYLGHTSVVYEDNTSSSNVTLKFDTILNINTEDQIKQGIIDKLIRLNCNPWNRRAARISEGLVDHETDIHKNKIMYKLKTHQKDDVIKWTDNKHQDMNKYKIMYPTLGNRILIDRERNLFPGTSFVVYITTDTLDEVENIEKLMSCRLFKYLENTFHTQRCPRDFIMRNLIKRGPFVNIETEDDIFKYFKLTSHEISHICKEFSS